MTSVSGAPREHPLSSLNQYEVMHLPAHLADAGKEDTLHRLLRMEWVDPSLSAPDSKDRTGSAAALAAQRARNAWFSIKEPLAGIEPYADDVMLAFRITTDVEPDISASRAWDQIATLARYAFMAASAHSLAARLPSTLRVAMLANGLWSPDRAIEDANGTPDLDARAVALLDLVPMLSGNSRDATAQKACALVRLSNSRDKAELLLRAADVSPESDRSRLLSETVSSVRAMSSPDLRAHTLAEVLRRRAPSRDARAGSDASAFDQDLATVLQEVLAEALTIYDPLIRVKAVAALAPHLDGAHREAVLRDLIGLARDMTDEANRAAGLSALATCVAEPSRRDVLLDEAQQAAEAALEWMVDPLMHGIERARAYGAIAESLRPDWTLSTASSTSSNQLRLSTWPGQVEQVALQSASTAFEGIREASIAATSTTGNTYDATTFAGYFWQVIPRLPHALLREATTLALSVSDLQTRIGLLARIAPRLPSEEQAKIATEAFQAAMSLGDRFGSQPAAEGIELIAPFLPTESLRHVVDAARRIGDEVWQTSVLEQTIPRLPETDIQEVSACIMDTARRIPGIHGSSGIYFAQLASLVGPEHRPVALRYALNAALEHANSGDSDTAVFILTTLAAEADTSTRQDLVAAALRILENAGPGNGRQLTGLLPYLEQPQLADAVRIADQVAHPRDRVNVYATIASCQSGVDREAPLQTAFDIAMDVAGAEPQQLPGLAMFLSLLTTHQRDELLGKAVETGRGMDDARRRAQTFVGLIPFLDEHQRDGVRCDAIETAWNVLHGVGTEASLTSSDIEMVLAVIPHVSPEQLSALGTFVTNHAGPPQLAHQSSEDRDNFCRRRASGLVQIASYLAGDEQLRLLDRVLTITREIDSVSKREEVMEKFVSVVPQARLDWSVEIYGSMTRGYHRSRVRDTIFERLSTEERRKLVAQRIAGKDSPFADEDLDVWTTLVVDDLSPVASENAQRLWSEFLDLAAHRERKNALSVMSTFLRESDAHASARAMVSLARAVHDVGTWWP